MNRATKAAASILGIYAGLLGMQHGYFEILQGSTAPGGVMINAVGPPCQADEVWHACLPALTTLSSLLFTGILAILVGLIVLVWAALFIQRKNGGLVLILLSLLLLLVGGGFVSAFIGVLAGATGTRINARLTWWRTRLNFILMPLSLFWPWVALILIVWFPGAWLLGNFFNQTILDLSVTIFILFDLGLPVLIVFSGITYDNRRIRFI